MSLLAPSSGTEDAEIRRLRTLYHLLGELSRASDVAHVYRVAVESLLESTSANRASILLFDDDGVIRFKASQGLSNEYQAAVTGHCPWKKGELGAKPIAVPDVTLDEDFTAYREIFTREGIRGLLFVPLALHEGVFGKFMLYYNEPHQCTTGELEISQAIAAHVALATQHKREELARRRSELQLEAIVDNSPAVIFIKDLDGRYLLVNKRFEDVFHVSTEKAVGRTDHEMFSAELADRFRANDLAVVEAGAPLSMEETAPHDDGLHDYISVKFPMLGPDGAPNGICGIATDITERKYLEAASRHLAAIVESSEDAVISKDLNGVITSWNSGAEKIFGYTAPEVVGKPIAILAPPDQLNEMPDILSKIRQGLRVEHFETRRRTKDGRIVDVALTVSPVRDALGTIVGASKIARDVTEKKIQEQERTTLHAREKSARRTAELLNKVGPRLAGQLDLQKLVQEVTDIATALVGAEFGSFFHNIINEQGESYMLYTLSGVSRSAFENFPMPRNTAVFGPTFRGEPIVRCDDVTKDPRYGKSAPHYGMPKGHLPVRSYLAASVATRSGEVIGGLFFGHSEPGMFGEGHEEIVRGIAAHAAIAIENARLFEQATRAQTELRRSNEELRRANRDLEAFAYSASHDLQEPLRTVAISAQLIERSWGAKLEGDDANFLSNIVGSAKRMSGLIEDLLAYTRATKYEEGAPPTVDAGRVFADVLEGMRASMEETGATVTADELPEVSIHSVRLAQLFQNLISNAIKYRSEEAPRIHVSADQREGSYIFSVRDNGIGIEPQYALQIFGLFKRLHNRDEYPGSGIGLAICQRIVEQYGGRIWVEQSEAGKGSNFCFSIPAGN